MPNVDETRARRVSMTGRRRDDRITMLTVALAGPSADLDRCESAVLAIRKFAICAFDWPAQVRRDRDAGLTDHDLTDDQREWVRRQCKAGIVACDALLWLASPSVGAAWETGYAEGLGKTIVIGGADQHPIYGDRRFASDDLALAYLRGLT